ncbi:glycosyltransferase [Hyalangium sp.]|uniref:glycosyltransferase n=1 Tax=Hyalangium sp. TaxID=2028555 RepID=UPI002D754BF4|nr:glycosyltransferase [Hyalangium sp.]HYH97949.1 glycosyltransferase [Hyalangium sp.]
MRVLFTTQPGIGHFRPLVPFARALEKAGHAVAFACAASFHPEVRASGFTCHAAGYDYRLAEVSKTFPDIPPPGPDRAPKMLALWRGAAAISMARDLLALAPQLAPDVIIHENFEFGASIAAERLGVPHVAAGALWFRPEAFGPLEPAIRELDLLPEAVGQFRHLALAAMPPRWVAEDEQLPETARFIQPEHLDVGAAPALEWLERLPPERPVVHATMGTTEVNRSPGLYEAIIAGLREEPITLIVATGHERDPAEFGPQPPHVRIERFIPHGALLPRCQLVVTHGGHGTLMACFGLGIPVVVLPVNADQPRNSARCEALGVGRAVGAPHRTPESIRAAVRAVLADPSYLRNVASLRAEIAALPGLDEATRLIEQLAAESSKKRSS